MSCLVFCWMGDRGDTGGHKPVAFKKCHTQQSGQGKLPKHCQDAGTNPYLSQSCSRVDLSSMQANPGESLLLLALILSAALILGQPRLPLRILSCRCCLEGDLTFVVVLPWHCSMGFPGWVKILGGAAQGSLQSSARTVIQRWKGQHR